MDDVHLLCPADLDGQILPRSTRSLGRNAGRARGDQPSAPASLLDVPRLVQDDFHDDVASVSRSLRRETHRTRLQSVTGFDRDQSSRPYANPSHYRVRALKVTTLVDLQTLYITDIHSITGSARKSPDAMPGTCGTSPLPAGTTPNSRTAPFPTVRGGSTSWVSWFERCRTTRRGRIARRLLCI